MNEKLAQEQKRLHVTAEAKHRRRDRPRNAEAVERVPRVARLLALALKFEEMIRSGVAENYSGLPH